MLCQHIITLKKDIPKKKKEVVVVEEKISIWQQLIIISVAYLYYYIDRQNDVAVIYEFIFITYMYFTISLQYSYPLLQIAIIKTP